MREPPTLIISMVATTINRHQWTTLFDRFDRPELPWLKPVIRLLDDFGDPEVLALGVERLATLCMMPYMFVSVLWDGTVVPCCHDFDGAIALGNLRKHNLAEVWQGEHMARFRDRWKNRVFDSQEPCYRCRWRPDLFAERPNLPMSDAWTKDAWDLD